MNEVVNGVWLQISGVLKGLNVFVQAIRWNVLPELPHVRRPEELPWRQAVVENMDSAECLHFVLLSIVPSRCDSRRFCHLSPWNRETAFPCYMLNSIA